MASENKIRTYVFLTTVARNFSVPIAKIFWFAASRIDIEGGRIVDPEMNEIIVHIGQYPEQLQYLIDSFEKLEKPVALVAHNGNVLQFKLLLETCLIANIALPKDLLYVDSRLGFLYLMMSSQVTQTAAVLAALDATLEDDDDDDDDDDEITADASDGNVAANVAAVQEPVETKGILKVYRIIFGEPYPGRAYGKKRLQLLVQCVVAKKELFLKWADVNHLQLSYMLGEYNFNNN